MITARDRSRLAALIAIVKPAHSLAARVDALNDDHRNYYLGWSAHWSQWINRHNDDDGRAYGLTLAGYGPVQLPADIATALHGAMPQILKTDSDNDAANKFREYCNADAR